MKIVHVIPNHPVMTRMAEFFSSKFQDYSFHVIIAKFAGNEKEWIQSSPDIEYIDMTNRKKCITTTLHILKHSDMVFFHSLFFNPIDKILISLKTDKSIYDKIVWIEWGFDLYDPEANNFLDVLKNMGRRVARQIFDKKIKHFVAIHPADINEYKKRVAGKANIYFAPYSSTNKIAPFILAYKKIMISERISQGSPVTIQIGHRADKILGHFKILDRLRPYRHENIKIIIPLSYGDKKYGDKVETRAKELFGEKVECLREIMPIEEYCKFQLGIDIYIQNSKRQIGLGNLYPIFLMEKKIYLPSDSVISRYYRAQGATVCDINEIGSIPFNEFVEDVDTTKGKELVYDYKTKDTVKLWSDVFDNILQYGKNK